MRFSTQMTVIPTQILETKKKKKKQDRVMPTAPPSQRAASQSNVMDL